MGINERTILVIGIGNTLRGDDGIGAYICAGIDRLGLKGVKTLIIHQLQIELLEELMQFDQIVLADAAMPGEPAGFYRADKIEKIVSSSHHINAGLLLALAKQLYGRNLPLHICPVTGRNFNIGEELSETVIRNTDMAIHTIAGWIEGGGYVVHSARAVFSTI